MCWDDVAGRCVWELCLQVDLRWNCRRSEHQSQQRDFVFRLCIPSFGGQVGEDSEIPAEVSGGEEILWVLRFWGLEMPTKDACQLDGSTPWGSHSKELQGNIPSSYSEKAKLGGMWWQTRTGVRTSKLPKVLG